MVLLAAIVASSQVFAASRSERAKEIKAGVMRHIVQATEFPEGTFSNPDAALIFAVVGRDPFGSVLDKTFGTALYRGRRIEIRRYPDLESVMPCHVLFVASSEQRDLEALLELVTGLGVLTLGDTAGFVTRGGMINVQRKGRRIGYEVNLRAAQNEGISFSSKVLALATAAPR
ncbi:MAG: YfiR family protein [Proteobacteria bacterium]|nr:YfiR family protein [Pseudomonadota bacterium]